MDTSEVPMHVAQSGDKEEWTMNPKENMSTGQNTGQSGGSGRESMVQTELTLVNVVDAIKDLALKIDKMDNTNTLNAGVPLRKRSTKELGCAKHVIGGNAFLSQDLVSRLDSIDKTNSSILVTLCRLVKAEATPTPKVVAENESLHGSGSNSPGEQSLDANMYGRTKVTSHRKFSKNKMNRKAEALKEISTVLISDSDNEDTDTIGKNCKGGLQGTKKCKGGLEGTYTRQKMLKSTFVGKNNPDGDTEMAEVAAEDTTKEKPFMSNYKGGVRSKVTTSVAHNKGAKRSYLEPRKLSFTPKTSQTATKKPRTNNSTPASTSKKLHGKKSSPLSQSSKGLSKHPSPLGQVPKCLSAVELLPNSAFRPTGQLIPKRSKCKFKSTTDMRLSLAEGQVCAFVFDMEKNLGDEVFSVGSNIGTRADFECLIPGKIVHHEMVLMKSLMVTWTQMNNTNKCLWCLPPSFAVDVTRGRTIEELHMFYGKDWMPPIPNLKLIYIPIEEEGGHWYLMVVHIDEKKVFHLDSYLTDEVLDQRRETIQRMSNALGSLILRVYIDQEWNNDYIDVALWDVFEPRGIPNCGNSDSSGLWVVEWMNMQHSFHHNIPGVMNDKKMRMKIAMRLLLGAHNQSLHMLLTKARDNWEELTYDPSD